MSKYAPVSTEEISNPFARDQIRNGDAKVLKWKRNIKLGCAAAVVVLVLNLCLLIWTKTHFRHASINGAVTVFSGNCSKARQVTLWSHLAINILGSILLAAGNTCMQCLTAPTRDEIDRAHAKHTWLDVGVNTVRNIRSISRSRGFLWACLVLSSVPLHLLYNSVIFEVNVVNDYMVAMTTEAFVAGTAWNHTRAHCFDISVDPNPTLTYLQENRKSLVQLTNTACFDAYRQDFVSDWGNLLVVTEDPPSRNETVLNIFESLSEEALSWVCHGAPGGAVFCQTPQDVTNASNWVVPVSVNPGTDFDAGAIDACGIDPTTTLPVKYCIAQPTPEACQVGVIPSLLIVVLICNLAKIICLIWTFWKLDFEPIVTLGDAITSFLDRPDSTTAGYGAISVIDIKQWTSGERFTGGAWKAKTTSGFGAASRKRWVVCSALFILFWIAALALLLSGLSNYRYLSQSTTFSAIVSYGIGRLNVYQMVADLVPGEVAGNAIIANIPQLLISSLYLLYNDLFTRIHIGAQWSSYSRVRKPLRVLTPRQHQFTATRQRSYYILSLPLRISLPLLVLMMILHWLISQSLFLAIVGVNDYTPGGATPVNKGYPILGLGWSPFALVLCLILGGLMILGLWTYAFMSRYGSGMPLVRTCSAAISAACHPPAWDVNASEQPVFYGVVQKPEIDQNGQPIPGHVCFTSAPAEPLIDGQVYL